MPNNPWTPEEEEFLKENRYKYTIQQLAQLPELRRHTRSSIKDKCANSFITKPKAPPNRGEEEMAKNDEKKIALMQEQVRQMLEKRKIPTHRYRGKVIKFGVVSDLHIGSIFERPEVLEAAYKVFQREGITRVYNPGDIVEGERIYRGQEYERYISGGDQLVAAAVEKYPQVKGITTYFITGNHDLSYWKLAGIDIGARIAAQREDMVYLGQEEADILLNGQVVLRLIHPGGGTAYAISYRIQKMIESLSGGEKPNIILVGHFHKADFLPCYRNVFAIQAGCLQSQTPFMRRRHNAAHVGFWTVEMVIDKDGSVSRMKPEFFAHYEEPIIRNNRGR